MCFLVPQRGFSNCLNEGINRLQSVVEEQVRKVKGKSISIQLRRCVKGPVNQRKGGNSGHFAEGGHIAALLHAGI